MFSHQQRGQILMESLIVLIFLSGFFLVILKLGHTSRIYHHKNRFETSGTYNQSTSNQGTR